MQDSKFLTLLRTLAKDELSAFDKHVKKLHRDEDSALSVLAYIRRFYPGFQDKKRLEMSYAYGKIFKENIEVNEYNRKKLLNILYDLHTWLKDFLIWEEVGKHSFESRSIWLKVLKRRGLTHEFTKQASLLQQELGSIGKKSIEAYINSMNLNYWLYNQFAQDKASPDVDGLLKCGNDLDVFYTVVRLKIACEMANLKNLISWETEMPEMPIAKELILQYMEDEHVLLALYFDVYQLISSNESDSFKRILENLSKSTGKIDSDELLDILSYLYNYTAAKLREGKEEFWVGVHELNKFGIAHEVFTHNETMTAAQFSNIINAACKVGEFDWAESFIETQNKYLFEEIRDEIVILSKAVIFFEMKDFNKTLQTLQGLVFKDIRHNIRTRSLILRSYFECGISEDKILEYCIAFEAFLQRHRKPKREAIEATLNYIKIVKILVQKKKEKSLIIDLIEKTKPIYFKAWLLEKLDKYKAEFATRKRSKRVASNSNP